jgi:membrane-associated phospholipid phosphatase
LCPDRFRILVWPSIIALATTRIMLLAHYVSDVVAGFGLGILLNIVVGRGRRFGWRPLSDAGTLVRRARWPSEVMNGELGCDAQRGK